MAQNPNFKMDEFRDIPNHPFGTIIDEISDYHHVQSTSNGGEYKDIITSTSLNFPNSTDATANWLFIKVPQWVDVTDLDGVRPVQLEDKTITSTMSRVVSSTTAPTGDDFMVPPQTSIKRDVIAISSTKLGHQISFDYYGIGSAINDNELNTWRNFLNKTLTSTSDYTQDDTDDYKSILMKTSDVGDMTVTLSTGVIDRETYIYKDNKTGKITIYGDYIDGSTYKILFSAGDYLKIKYDGTNHIELSCKSIINTGWISNNDWTNRHLGTINLDYDSFGGTIIDGERVICTTTSSTATQAEGYVMSSTGSTSTIIIRDITSTGATTLFPNNAELIFELSGSTALVNEGTGSAKDLDNNFFHNTNKNLFEFKHFFFGSSDGTWDTAFYFDQGMNEEASVIRGTQRYQVDNNNFKLQTGQNGIQTITDSGVTKAYDTDDEFYFLKMEYIK